MLKSKRTGVEIDAAHFYGLQALIFLLFFPTDVSENSYLKSFKHWINPETDWITSGNKQHEGGKMCIPLLVEVIHMTLVAVRRTVLHQDQLFAGLHHSFSSWVFESVCKQVAIFNAN